MRHNGFANYQTWCVHLWLTSETIQLHLCRQMASACRTEARECWHVKQKCWPLEDSAKFLLSDKLRMYVEERNPLLGKPSLYGSLVEAALRTVNWHELAEAFLKE